MMNFENNKGLTVKGVNSANVKVDNSGDDTRRYDIEGNVEFSGGAVQSVNGVMRSLDGGTHMGSFNSWGGGGLSVSFDAVADEERCTVLSAVQQFIEDVKTMRSGE